MAISLVTLCAVLGRTLLGWLLGERDRRLAAAANLLMQAAGSLLLAFGEGMGRWRRAACCSAWARVILCRCRP